MILAHIIWLTLKDIRQQKENKTHLLNRTTTYFSVFMRFKSSSSCTVSRLAACEPEEMHIAIKSAICNIVNLRETGDNM